MVNVEYSGKRNVGEIVDEVDKDQLETCVQASGVVTWIFYIMFTLLQFSQKSQNKEQEHTDNVDGVDGRITNHSCPRRVRTKFL